MPEEKREDVKKIFSREGIQKKQKDQREEYERKSKELRKALEDVAVTASGEKALRYLFLLCGGDTSSIRRSKDSVISLNDTLVTLGAKSVWETIRINLTSDTIKRLERHNWEE